MLTHLSRLQAPAFLKNKKQAHRTPVKKHHYLLGTAAIVLGSWITHTTTATVYNNINEKEAMAFSEKVLTDGGLPQQLFNGALSTTKGPISRTDGLAQSPIPESELSYLELPKVTYLESKYKVRSGDTLGSIFNKLQYDSLFAHNINLHPIAKQLSSLKIGKHLAFRVDNEKELKQLAYPVSPLEELLINFEGASISDASIVKLPHDIERMSVSGEIKSSLYEAAKKAGLSTNMVMELVRIFGWDVDFVLDIREGDSFHVIYEQFERDGERVADGNLLAAEFTTQDRTYRAIRFDDGQGNVSYYTPQGESMLGTFLRSPVEFSRISSRFGKRKHPILKTWRAHKGVDYAARRGTPIRATADGKVISAGTKGGYGKAIVLRHAGRFTTLYGHMNGFAKGVKTGARVKQGDVIGYIGSTGLATGPHLHYEFRLDGVHRNPLTYKTPKAGSVAAELKSKFTQESAQWLTKLDRISNEYQIAKARSANLTSEAF